MKTPKSFEEGMERLNGVLAKMQSEETTLADSVKLYAEGVGARWSATKSRIV